jgi:arsenate reductase
MSKRKVLFLCTRNTARSQIAEALLKKHAGDKFEAFSAGLDPIEIHPYTYQVLDEIGIDIHDQYPKATTDLMGRMFFDYVIAVCRSVEPRCPTVYPDTRNFQRWLFDDPVVFEGNDADKLRKFRQVRDQIDQRLQLWISETTG